MTKPRVRALLAVFAASVIAVAAVGCGDDNGTSTTGGAGLIEKNPANADVTVTVGSKNFDEQFILGEIYAQGLEAAGYNVKTDLNLGSEQVALKALQNGDISGYPEYTSTALTSFFGVAPQDVPGDAQKAFEDSKGDFAKLGLEAFPPTPFSSANGVGMLTSRADELGVSSISDLEGKSQDLTLYGSPECRQRIDCLLGLEKYYGLEFKKFVPVDIGLRYEVLDKGDADLSILFTSDGQLANSDKYTLLEDDKQVLPAGNILFVASKDAVDQAGPDFGATIQKVQENLTLPVMQELNARVTLDKEEPAQAAKEYLQQFGYIG